MFGNQSLPSVIYRYGARPPVTGTEEVERQMRRANHYRNKLVEIELERRQEAEAIVMRLAPKLADVERSIVATETAIEAVRDGIRKGRAKSRKLTDATPEQRVAIAEHRAALTLFRTERKELRYTAYRSDEARAAMKVLDAKYLQRDKDARAESGLYWGTYLSIEQAMSDRRKGAPPRFARYRDEGKLAVQLQGGLMAESAYGCEDARLRIERIDCRHANVWMRIGSDDNRRPLWAVIPAILHRPIPADASIKWAYLTKRMTACHPQWAVCFVLAREAGWAKSDTAQDGAVGIDVGWRVLEHGLRVASWVGTDGDAGELILPTADVARWQKCRDLQSIRDTRFDAARDWLAAWLAEHADVPAWLLERCETLRQWRSQARLAAVVVAWRDLRFDGDVTIFAEMEAWRKRDKHLWTWQEAQRAKAIRWREDVYRNFAAQLSRRYETAYIEDTNWRKMGELPDAEDTEAKTPAAYYRTVASPGRLLEIVRERFSDHAKMPAENTTQRCHVCGGLVGFDAARHLEATCQHCGAEWDQDVNAAHNLLSSGAVA